MSIWNKVANWARRDKNAPPVPPMREPTEVPPSYETQWASCTKPYKSGKWRAAARRAHHNNRRDRLKDPMDVWQQKLRKLGCR